MNSILLVDPWPIVTRGLSTLLHKAGIENRICEAHGLHEALQSMSGRLALLIFDPAMTDTTPDRLVDLARRTQRDLPILFFGNRGHGLYQSLAHMLAVNGYLEKNSNAETIVATVRTVMAGMQCFPHQSSFVIGCEAMVQKLSPKELVILAADQGNAEAQFKLAWMLEKGKGVLKSEEEAAIWYERAALQGHGIAANNLGGMYADGRGVPSDPAAAFEWYRRAAELGSGHGHYNMAVGYRDGFGVPQDTDLARRHFELARNAGVSEAAAQLSALENRSARAAISAMSLCGEAPPRYMAHMFGELLYSLDAGCMRVMTEREQVFTAGMSKYFLEQCAHPTDVSKRNRLISFVAASSVVAVTGSRYADPDIIVSTRSQVENSTLYTLGSAAAEEIGCNEISERLASNIVAYLDETALGRPDGPNYVDGCVARYTGQYDRSQCECLAHVGRTVFPDIHSQAFAPSSIKAIIDRGPLLGFQIAFMCGIVEY